jgi:hypothetical protein
MMVNPERWKAPCVVRAPSLGNRRIPDISTRTSEHQACFVGLVESSTSNLDYLYHWQDVALALKPLSHLAVMIRLARSIGSQSQRSAIVAAEL